MLLCQYSNPTGQPQVLRITSGSNNIDGERVVLPKQSITFYTNPEAMLEVISGQPMTAMIEARIPCKRLCLKVIKVNLPQVTGKATSLKQQTAVQSLQMMDLSAGKTLPGDRGESAPTFEKV
jgi:hypothetical protein